MSMDDVTTADRLWTERVVRWAELRRSLPSMLALAAAIALVCSASMAQDGVSSVAAGTVDFVRDVQPILVKHCHPCHGSDEQSGGLRLDRKTDALRGDPLRLRRVESKGHRLGPFLIQPLDSHGNRSLVLKRHDALRQGG